jgi:hypothetical protein
MAMNKEWHAQNKMPKNASTEQRLAWHLEHRKRCSCRPMPKSLLALLPQGQKSSKRK